MNLNRLLLLIFLCGVGIANLFATIKGIVLDDKGFPLVGANVYWAETTIGTSTDIEGTFTLSKNRATDKLVTSFMGFHNDTTEITRSMREVTIVLVSDLELEEVDIVERKMAVLRSRVSPLNVQTLTGEELCKAACCNLSESFETSASVDVSYADAATGAKQIRLLGLSGTYVQLLTENTPNVRGLAQSFGMEYIPGPWMEAIQVSKGTSSVLNGYEAITGQINVEYLKPQTTNPIAVNAMLNKDLRAELNLTGGWDINDKVSTGLLLHAKDASLEMDDNGDGFLDMPINHHANLLNRWYIKTGDYTGQILVRALYDQRIGGQTEKVKEHIQQQQPTLYSPYTIDLRTRRIDGFIKNGYVFDQETGMSIGIIASASYHHQSNVYGNRIWNAAQTNAYLNAIFQTNFVDDYDLDEEHEHKLSAGLSVNYDHYNEVVELYKGMPLDLTRGEITAGLFAEYTYLYQDKLTLLVGIREDYSNQYGFFTTPRMNIRYAPFEWWTLRGSVGLGYRSPNLVADNANYLSSNRNMLLMDANGNNQWMTKFAAQEKTLNSGLSTTFYIPIATRELQLSGEYYFTNFFDGVIVDVDRTPGCVYFYNMSDNSQLQQLAHNWQIEANMEILRGWTMTMAFRYTDVRQTTYNEKVGDYQLRDKPLQNKFKGIISTSYQTPLKKWQFDLTAQFNGYGRMPDGFVNPNNGQYFVKDDVLYHTWYPQLLGQVTKYFKTWSIYVGAENMTNFKQHNPILGETITNTSYVDAHSASYDATQVWGPIHGWKIYLGFRWALDRPEE